MTTGTSPAAAGEPAAEKIVPRQFVLTGFSQDGVFRVFGFRGIAADRTQLMYAVRRTNSTELQLD